MYQAVCAKPGRLTKPALSAWYCTALCSKRADVCSESRSSCSVGTQHSSQRVAKTKTCRARPKRIQSRYSAVGVGRFAEPADLPCEHRSSCESPDLCLWVMSLDVRDGGAFGGSSLDRLNNQRSKPSFVETALDASETSFLVVHPPSCSVLTRINPDTGSCALLWLDRESTAGLIPAVGHTETVMASLCVDPSALSTKLDCGDALRQQSQAHTADPDISITLLGATSDRTLANASSPRVSEAPPVPKREYRFAIGVASQEHVLRDGGPACSKARMESVRGLSSMLSREEAAVAAHAVSVLRFHTAHTFCGTCGARTLADWGGARRRCRRNVVGEGAASSGSSGVSGGEASVGSCPGMWFPRIDPVAIALVVDRTGEQCLLGRQSRFPPGMWSCVAGFMEHGECVDDAVRREVQEETGVVVGNRVRLFGSQPWPLPYSLMLGCVAQVDGDMESSERIVVDTEELEDARWFRHCEVVEMVAASALKAQKGAWSRRTRPRDSSEANMEDVAQKSSSTFERDADSKWVPPVSSISGQMLAAYANQDPITCFRSARM